MTEEKTGKHPRYHAFTTSGTGGDGNDTLRAVLFKDDTKLRSHAVKHFFSLAEQEYWLKLGTVRADSITRCVDGLRELGCPYLAASAKNPPCWAGNARCRLFAPCGELASPLEEAFLDGCRKIVQQGMDRPRSVLYQCGGQEKFWWFLADMPIVAKFAQMGEFFNLMTCYRPMAEIAASWKQIRSHVINAVRSQSTGGAEWRNPETWGLEPPSEQSSKRRADKDSSRKPACKKNVKKLKQSGWRSYLDSLED